MSNEQQYAYVGICPKCKALCCAAADKPERTKDNAKHVGKWMRDGLIVERVTADEVRKRLSDCTCVSSR